MPVVPKRLTPPIKIHGGKYYLAQRIVALMPVHKHYVEPYFGGGSVLLAKDPEGISEVVNDLDSRLVNFWNILRCENTFKQLQRMVETTSFSQKMWEDSHHQESCAQHPSVECAFQFFVQCRQSLAGRRDTFATLSRTRTRRGMNEQVSAWLTAIEGLPAVYHRMKRVAVLCANALKVIASQDGPDTLFYLDPPYLQEVRASNGEYGQYEVTPVHHQLLLLALSKIKGRFMLSGYDSELYRTYERNHGWSRVEFTLPNNAASGKNKRRMTEVVWANFKLSTKD